MGRLWPSVFGGSARRTPFTAWSVYLLAIVVLGTLYPRAASVGMTIAAPDPRMADAAELYIAREMLKATPRATGGEPYQSTGRATRPVETPTLKDLGISKAERKMGEMLLATKRAGGTLKQGPVVPTGDYGENIPTLSDLGITKNESARASASRRRTMPGAMPWRPSARWARCCWLLNGPREPTRVVVNMSMVDTGDHRTHPRLYLSSA